MVAQGSQRVQSRWDITGSRAGSRDMNLASDIDHENCLLAEAPIERSNHDRVNGVLESEGNGLGLYVKKTNVVPGLRSKTSQTSIPSRLSGKRRRRGSTDNEGLLFPTYEEFTKSKSTTNAPNDDSDYLIREFVDDTFLRHPPTVHVDYLAHDWNEEDIWSAWKHISSPRESYNHESRLKNACWRTWEKKRSRLRTTSPESIKWVKDHDLTWLYGPLIPQRSQSEDSLYSNGQMMDSGIDLGLLKPILKTPSLCDILMYRSINTVSRQSSPGRRNMSVSSQKSSPKPEKSVRFQDEVVQCVPLVRKYEQKMNQDKDTRQDNKNNGRIVLDEVEAPSNASTASMVKDSAIIQLLPPNQLKVESKRAPVPTQRADTWPSRPLLPTWYGMSIPEWSTSGIDYQEDNEWLSPAPKHSSRSNLLDERRTLSDDELFELEMFGISRHDAYPQKVDTNSAAENSRIQSSPGLSDNVSSSSDPEDEEEEEDYALSPSTFSPATATNPIKPDCYFGNFNWADNKLPSQTVSNTSPIFEVQEPKSNSTVHALQVEESGMDDEDHWWMNV